MPHPRPLFDRFQKLARRGNFVPMYRRLFSDQLTPVMAYRRLVRPDERMAPSFLLESVVGGEHAARYSFVAAQPIAEIVARDRRVTRRVGETTDEFECDDPMAEMRKLSDGLSIVPLPELPDFTGGWVGYAGYDTIRYAEGEKLSACR